jgi:UDP-perosamine 4-acetyltransferase
MKPLIIIGTGGHSKVLIDIAKLGDCKILGYTVPEKNDTSEVNGLPVLCTDDEIDSYKPSEVLLVNGIGSVANTERRRAIFEKFKKMGYEFASLIHPSAVIAEDTKLGEGANIMAGAILQPGVVVGQNAIINTKASLDHDTVVGDHTHIAPGTTISGNVTIGNSVHIGTGASIIHGIKIESFSLIGAAALVIRDVKPRQMVMGVPAKLVKTFCNWQKAVVKPDTSIKSVIKIIDNESIRVALVADNNQKLLGIITDGDIRRALIADRPLTTKACEIMNPNPITMREKTTRRILLKTMYEKQINQIPIVDSRNRLINLELLENLSFCDNA